MKMPRSRNRLSKRCASDEEEETERTAPAKKSKTVNTKTEKRSSKVGKSPVSNLKAEASKENAKSKQKGSSNSKRELLIGCHVSAAGGVQNSVGNAVGQQARAFAMFLTNQRQWNAKPLDDDVVDKFKQKLESSGIPVEAVVPHGIYLLNCASPNPETLRKSRAKLLEEVQRCERLGIQLYNFHPGSTVGEISREEGIHNIVDSINGVLDATSKVTLLIENMAGQKNTIGNLFEDLKRIIDGVMDKSRIGVCLDTCHTFAAGFDIRSSEAYDKTIEMFDQVVGLKYLKAIHLNDSMKGLGSHLDRHADIGEGMIGLDGFRNLVNDPRMANIPMILETPGFEDYNKQISLLYSLVK